MATKKSEIDEKQVKDWIERGVKKLENLDCDEKKGWKRHSGTGAASSVWCFGFFGSVIYFLQQATSVGSAIIGVLKAIVWPAYLVYYLFNYLKI